MLEFWATRGVASEKIASPNRTTPDADRATVEAHGFSRAISRPKSWALAPDDEKEDWACSFSSRYFLRPAPDTDCTTVEAHGFIPVPCRRKASAVRGSRPQGWALAPEKKIRGPLLMRPM